MAFRRNRNFASVQVYNQKRVVCQIGHFGTGDLEITLKTAKYIAKTDALIAASYTDS